MRLNLLALSMPTLAAAISDDRSLKRTVLLASLLGAPILSELLERTMVAVPRSRRRPTARQSRCGIDMVAVRGKALF